MHAVWVMFTDRWEKEKKKKEEGKRNITDTGDFIPGWSSHLLQLYKDVEFGST